MMRTRVAVRGGVRSKQVARTDLERQLAIGDSRIQTNHEVLIRTGWMELHHLVRADRLADFQRKPRLACPRRTFENDEPSLAQQRCDRGRIGDWEDPCVHLLQACLPLGLRNSFVAAAVLVEEEIQQVGDCLQSVGIAWTDSRGRIEDGEYAFIAASITGQPAAIESGTSVAMSSKSGLTQSRPEWRRERARNRRP